MKKYLVLFLLFLGSFLLISCGESIVSDHQKVFDELKVIYADNETSNNVKSDLGLPTTSTNVPSAIVTWTSSNEDVLEVEGEVGFVNRQGENVLVNLTISVEIDEVVKSKTYEIKVVKIGEIVPVMTYIVKFDADGGSPVPEDQVIEKGNKASLVEIPTKDGYTFEGWLLDEVLYDFDTPVTKEITLVAKWKQHEIPPELFVYTVTFDTNGGSEILPVDVEDGEKVLKPEDPTKDGHTFKGWLLNEAPYDFNTPITKAITLVANWEEDEVELDPVLDAKILFDFSNLSGNESADLFDKEEDLNALFENDNYIPSTSSTGKFYAGTGRVKFSTASINGDLKLVFEKNIKFSTVVIYAYGWLGDSNETIQINEENPVVVGKEVLRYVVDLSESSNEITFLATKRILITKIELYGEEVEVVVPKYEVIFNADGGTPVPETQNIEENDYANEPTEEVLKTGYDFLGWYLGDLEFDFENTPIVRDIEIKAKWEMIVEEYIEDANVEFGFDNLTSISTKIMEKDYLKEKYTNDLLDDIVVVGSVYEGNGTGSANYSNTTGLIKFGASSATGSLKFVFDGNVKIKTVIIYVAGWNSDEGAFIVNGINPAGTGNVSDTKTRYEVELDDATNEIIIGTTSKRGFLFAVGFYGPEAEVPEPPVIVEWEVSFDLNYDEAPSMDSVMVENGEKVNKPAAPSRTGYSFEGWLLDDNPYSFTEEVTKDITLIADWKKEEELDEDTFIEDFSKSELTGSYAAGSFKGNHDITWTYVASRDQNNDANNSGINGKAIMFHNKNNPTLTSSVISGGISYFEVKLYKGFTGAGNRQIEVFINGVSIGKSEGFDDNIQHIFKIDNLAIEGEFTIQIKNAVDKQVILDDITWKSYNGSQEPKEEYELTFNTMGGTPIVPTQNIEEGLLITKPTGLTNGDLVLEGWYDNEDFLGSAWNFDVDKMPSNDLTLYANWIEDYEGSEIKVANFMFGDNKYTGSETKQNGSKTVDGLAINITSSTAYWDGNANNSLRLGSSKNPGSITLAFNENVKITKVIIYASQYDGAVSIQVDSSTAQKVTGSTSVGYEFDIADLSELTIFSVNTSKTRLQIQKIVIEYEL